MPILLIGVTVLTNMEQDDLARNRSDVESQEQEMRLGALAESASMGVLGCSAQKAQTLKWGASSPDAVLRGSVRRAVPSTTNDVS